MAKRVIIVGGGIGGLSAAIRLQSQGYQVTILEKNASVGGKMSQISDGDFRWDAGPSVITMKHVFDDLFAAAGRNFDDYVTLLPVEPSTRYFYPDGTKIDASSDPKRMAAEISKVDKRDVKGYQKYLKYAETIHNVTGPVFIYDHPPSPASFAKVPITKWMKADPLRSMQDAIKSHVRSPQMRQLLGRFATYVGGSPYDAPATLNVIAHVELSGGVYYPQGGIYRLAEGMAQLAEELGVEICTDTPVQQIAMKNNHITGVTLANGDKIDAEIVVANLDVTSTYKHLLPKTSYTTQRLQKLESFDLSCSGFIMMLGVEGTYPQLAHHNIFFSRDYQREFKQIFNQSVPPDEPTIYISITSKADPDHAPDGHENWFLLVNAPALSKRYDWAKHTESYRERVLNRLAKFGIDVRERIVTEHIMTPADLQAHNGAWRGALYGQSPNSKWTAFRRPNNRDETISGLYFAGGTTHPGGGVPMVTLSGKVAAEMIAEDFG